MQACCSYYKAFSYSYIFIFYLEVLGKEHTRKWDQSRTGTEECYLSTVYIQD